MMILSYGEKLLGKELAVLTLLTALSLPLAFGLYEYLALKKKNWLSIFGLLSVLLTGGLALYEAEGIYFALSESALPAVLGIGVLISAFTKKPFVALFAYNDAVFNTEMIRQKLQEANRQRQFDRLLKESTILFSASFFLSSFLNFVLAYSIFKPIPFAPGTAEKTQVLNEQLGAMRFYTIFVIMIPLLIVGALILWHLIRGIRRVTQLDWEQIVRSSPSNSQ